jgi:hypothetical protein
MKREIILDDFTKKDSDLIRELVLDALIDIGYQDKGGTIENFSWQIEVNLEYS